jgi:coatomer protein complex subunit epsilon
MADELFEARNLFTLGNYQAAINKATKLTPTAPSVKIDRDVLVHRARIAQRNYAAVIAETASITPTGEFLAIAAVRVLAMYWAGDRDAALAEIKKWTGDVAAMGAHPAVQLIVGIVLANEGKVEEALRALHTPQPSSLECMALIVQLYIGMGRQDLAEAQQRAMCQVDEDSPLSQLCTAWVLLSAPPSSSGDKAAEAQLIFQELTDKYGPTPSLLQGQAICSMRGGRWAEAERFLADASERAGSATAIPDSIVNTAVCALHTGATQSPAKHLAMLKAAAPAHPWIARINTFEEAVQAAAAKYSLPQ